MAIEYVFVDTCVLSDIIRQYNPLCPRNPLQEGNYLKKDMLRYVNQIITDVEDNGYIIASTFAFVELINKLDDIFSGIRFKGEIAWGCESAAIMVYS